MDQNAAIVTYFGLLLVYECLDDYLLKKYGLSN